MENAFDEIHHVERQQFFDGQGLYASDLQDLEAFHRRMRWLHNQSLHQPGIGNGLAVYGKEGDRQVTISPGYAIDAMGREIVLIKEKMLQVPPVAGDRNGRPVHFDLTVSYPDDERLEVVETREGICADRGTVRLQEEPVFCWVRLSPSESSRSKNNESQQPENNALASDVKQGKKIVVGRVTVLNCQLIKNISLEQRRNARPSNSNKIICGTYKPEHWKIIWFDEDMLLKRLADYVSSSDDYDAWAIISNLFQLEDVPNGCINGFPFALSANVPTRASGALCYNVRIDGSHLTMLPPLSRNKDYRLTYIDASLQVQSIEAYVFSLFMWPMFGVLAEIKNEQREKLKTVNLIDHWLLLQKEIKEVFLISYDCLRESQNVDDEKKAKCVESLLTTIEEYLSRLFVPEDWQIVWMGVEG